MNHGFGCGEPRWIAAAILLRSDWVAGLRPWPVGWFLRSRNPRLSPIASIEDTMNANAPTFTMTVDISILRSLIESMLLSVSHRTPGFAISPHPIGLGPLSE